MTILGISGSTISDWIIFSGEETITEFSLMGFNPFFHNEVLIREALRNHPEVAKYKLQIDNVIFYGAGCSSERRRGVVERALKFIFQNSTSVFVGHDLDAAVHATCDGKPGIACILGTGSNSCLFNGSEIIEMAPALGHILGDEGGGAYFGRELLILFLYKKLPKHLYEYLIDRHGLTPEVVFENVYNMPNANVYLASFMRMLSKFKEDAFVQDFIYKGFSKFITHHVWVYKGHKELPTHFAGSVAHFFEDLLREASYKHRIEVGQVIKRPIENLIVFHKNELL